MKKIKQLNLRGKKIAIDGPVNSYSDRISSHKSAHAYYYYSKLKWLGAEEVKVITKKDNIHDYDMWLIVLPKEFEGSFNVFGGATDDLAERLYRLTLFEGEIYIADREMPDIGEWIQSRKSSCTEGFQAIDTKLFTKRCNEIETIDFDLDSKGFVLGDSHSISVYRPGYDLSRNDGKTLSGALKDGLKSYLSEDHNIEHLITYFVNIDIRHHFNRKDDLGHHIKRLLSEYEKQLKGLGIEKISIVEPLWIEDESRKLPKTGYFLGEPFSGSMKTRIAYVNIMTKYFRKMCERNGWESIPWPQNMRNDEGTLDFMYMEKPKSVHLSREFYHFDHQTNERNSKFFDLFQN